MIILHGDHQPDSRKRLVELMDAAQAAQQNIAARDADSTTPDEIYAILGRESLFGQTELVVIEGLHSLPTGNKRKELTGILAEHSQNPNVILWEKKSLSATQLKKFPKAQVQEFKIAKQLFVWLDSLSPQADKSRLIKLFHQVSDQESSELGFLMLARQLRLLIQTKEGIKPPAGAPFMITKLRRQASFFSMPQLLNLHTQLLDIDVRQKTGQAHLDLQAELDLWLMQL